MQEARWRSTLKGDVFVLANISAPCRQGGKRGWGGPGSKAVIAALLMVWLLVHSRLSELRFEAQARSVCTREATGYTAHAAMDQGLDSEA